MARKFKFLPRFLFDRFGLMINRDEVRTPMQWDGSKNAGFSAAERTWLPVHENFREINVEKERAVSGSLLNTIRAVLKIRRQELTIQEGTLEILQGLPHGILGYARKLGGEKLFILLNFAEQEKEFPFEASETIFRLSERDEVQQKAIRLDGFGGMILK
jgi:glycosidase